MFLENYVFCIFLKHFCFQSPQWNETSLLCFHKKTQKKHRKSKVSRGTTATHIFWDKFRVCPLFYLEIGCVWPSGNEVYNICVVVLRKKTQKFSYDFTTYRVFRFCYFVTVINNRSTISFHRMVINIISSQNIFFSKLTSRTTLFCDVVWNSFEKRW